jgi:lipid-A-disaccharide synthase-like uncharacterized protein
MTDFIRLALYFPLGLAPSLFFGSRFLVQWIQSEKKKSSIVTPLFWKLSLAGNILLMLHYLIQVQYPFALIQATNGIISWRNLNLMNAKRPLSKQATIWLMAGAVIGITLAFALQSLFLIGEWDFVRTPTKFFNQARVHHATSWHVLGAVSGTLFASRFWIQWWQAEKHQRSELGAAFWWLSIAGSLLSLIYFIRIQDVVSIFNQGFGLVPYIRNLMLMNRNRKKRKNVPI